MQSEKLHLFKLTMMMKMNFLWVFLIITLEASAAPSSFTNQDETEGGHFQGSGLNTEAENNTVNRLPEFMSVLYQCWSKRDINNNNNDDNYKQCLKSIVEGDKVQQIIDSNTVTGFIGNFASKQQMSEELLKHSIMSFNVSTIKPNEEVKFSELRIFKQAISMESIHRLSNDICNFDNGVNATLLAEMSNGQMQVIDKQLIECQMLGKDDWIVFTSVSNILNDWIRNNNDKCLTISIALEGGCGSVSPESIGIKEVPMKLPLLAAFLQSNGDVRATQEMLVTNSRTKRDVKSDMAYPQQNSHACRLNNLTVNFADLGWNNFILAPPSYPANYCSGTCHYPLSPNQNATMHSQIQSFYYLQDKPSVSPPCCVPTKLSAITVIMILDSRTTQIKVIQEMAATECGCR